MWLLPSAYPKWRGLQYHWNKVYSYRTLQRQSRILLCFSSPLLLSFPSAHTHLSWVSNFLVVPVHSALARGWMLTFTSFPLLSKLLLDYLLLETEQKWKGTVKIQRPNFGLLHLTVLLMHNLQQEIQSTIINPSIGSYRLIRTNFEVSRLKALASITFIRVWMPAWVLLFWLKCYFRMLSFLPKITSPVRQQTVSVLTWPQK